MTIKTNANTNIRMSQSTREIFDHLFEESGSNSKGEFMAKLLDRYDNPTISKPTEKIVEVERLVEEEKQLQANQLIISLSDSEFFVLKETVLSFNDFAERQNKIIDSFAPEHDSIFALKHLYSPEIYQLWRRFEPINESMTINEREKVVKSNFTSCLFNAFLFLHFIQERSEGINESLVTPRIIREFIKQHNEFIET
jgi:hypothetical protein